jgi:hypothetical protein
MLLYLNIKVRKISIDVHFHVTSNVIKNYCKCNVPLDNKYFFYLYFFLNLWFIQASGLHKPQNRLGEQFFS